MEKVKVFLKGGTDAIEGEMRLPDVVNGEDFPKNILVVTSNDPLESYMIPFVNVLSIKVVQ